MTAGPKDYHDNFFEFHLKGALSSAEAIIPVVTEYINPVSVIDVGCGIGAWLSVWKKKGIKEVMGIDGEYVDISKLLIEKSEFKVHNLEKSFTLNKKYELVTCLEVAEHLPEQCAESFICNLCMLGDVILFSAAIPGQGGTNHLNEQYPDYWTRIFGSYGFIPIDCIRLRVWDNSNIMWWYRQNIVFFVKNDKLPDYPLLALVNRNESWVRTFIHPALYTEVTNKLKEYHKYSEYKRRVFKFPVLIMKYLVKAVLKRNI